MAEIESFLDENKVDENKPNLNSINEAFITNKDKFIDKIIFQDNLSISTKVQLLDAVEKIAQNKPIKLLESHEIGVALQKLKL